MKDEFGGKLCNLMNVIRGGGNYSASHRNG